MPNSALHPLKRKREAILILSTQGGKMTDFNTDKNTQFAEDKAKNKLDELAGSAQQQFGDFVDSPKHQVKGAAKKYAAQASDAVSDVTEAVRNNPLTGLIAAGAVGIVLGLLLGRK